MNASPQDGLIVRQHRSFLKPRESGTSPALTRARDSIRRDGAACRDLLQNLVGRGLDPGVQRLFIIDG
jgi:hypothetical protein